MLVCAACNGGSCAGNGASCSFTNTCGQHTFSSQCTANGEPTFTCGCYVDGVTVGQCSKKDDPKGACAVNFSCCEPLFFINC